MNFVILRPPIYTFIVSLYGKPQFDLSYLYASTSFAVSYISIHAPVKGATLYAALSQQCPMDFNPRTREGCDVLEVYIDIVKVRISIHAPVKGATAKRDCMCP